VRFSARQSEATQNELALGGETQRSIYAMESTTLRMGLLFLKVVRDDIFTLFTLMIIH
jgi:hypothetical protein